MSIKFLHKIILSIFLIVLCTSCTNNSVQKQSDEVWFVKFQTGVLAGKCYHMYHRKIHTSDGTLTLQNRSMLPVTVSISNHSVTRKRVYKVDLLPGQIFVCDNLSNDIKYCVSLIIDDGKGSKNGVIAVYGNASILPFNYMEAVHKQHNPLIDMYNKMFGSFQL